MPQEHHLYLHFFDDDDDDDNDNDDSYHLQIPCSGPHLAVR